MILVQAIITQWLGRIIFRLRCLPAADQPAVERPVDLAQVKSVVIVRLDEIGDIVMFSPFLRQLRRGLPNARITLVVKPGVFNLVEFCPYVDDVIAFDQRGGRAARVLGLPLRAFRFAAQRLWKQRFDLAILPRWDADYYYAAFVAFWSGARRRLGYSETTSDYKQVVNRGFDRLLTTAISDRTMKHDVAHNSALLRSLGISADDDREEVWLTAQDRADADALLLEESIRPGDLVIGLGPFGRAFRPQTVAPRALCHFRQPPAGEAGGLDCRHGGPGEEGLGEALAQETRSPSE